MSSFFTVVYVDDLFRTDTSIAADSTSLEMITVFLLDLHELDFHWWFEHSFFGEILFVLSVKITVCDVDILRFVWIR